MQENVEQLKEKMNKETVIQSFRCTESTWLIMSPLSFKVKMRSETTSATSAASGRMEDLQGDDTSSWLVSAQGHISVFFHSKTTVWGEKELFLFDNSPEEPNVAFLF